MKQPNEIKLTIDGKETNLQEVLNLHSKWLRGEDNGKRANLQDAELQGADLQRADLQDANLQGAYLQDANLRGAYLRGAYLQDANLRGAYLQDAYLQDANLQGAYLRGAYLQDANLRGAYLRGADLQGADLQDAELDFSCMPLWCGDLKANYDDKQIIQQVYHVASHIKFSKNVTDEDLKALLESDLFKKIANKFHRVDECGEV